MAREPQGQAQQARRALRAVAAPLLAIALAVAGLWAMERWGPAGLAALRGEDIELGAPQFLWGLLAVPALVLLRWRSLSDLPWSQQVLSWGLKALALVALVAALAEPQAVTRVPARTATVFVVDVSESVPDAALERAQRVLQAAWAARGEDDVRLVVFAGEAREVPLPVGQPTLPPIPRLGPKQHQAKKERPEGDDRQKGVQERGQPGPQTPGRETDIEGALVYALALLPEGWLPRVVLVTDGLETRGSALAAAGVARRFGAPVHFVDLTDAPRPGELMVLGLEVPQGVKTRVPFEVMARVRSTVGAGQPGTKAAKAPKVPQVRCELTVDGVLTASVDVELGAGAGPDGVQRVRLPVKLDEGGERRLEVRCQAVGEPEARRRVDRFASNNAFAVTVRLPERPKVLYVEGERRFQKNLVAALQRDFDVEVRGPRGVPSSLRDAQNFDVIFVSDVPRRGELGYDNVTTDQMRVLERYARAGGGLVFAGGENSFGPGGYGGTLLERKVLPVKLDVQRREDEPALALMLVIDRSGSMSGEKIELAKEAARATLEVLQPNDRLGIIAFDSRPSTIVKLQRASNRLKITDSVRRLTTGGGTDIFPALDRAYTALEAVNAKVKHIILLTDGQSNKSGILERVQTSYEDKITISTVAVGRGADRHLLTQVAELGGGRYYFTDRADNIPKLFLKETSEVTRQALVEDEFQPRVRRRYRKAAIFRGLDMTRAPVLLGYVATRAKRRAEVLMTTHLGEPLLARWRLGLGWVWVWTSDVKNRWSHFWLRWGGYAKFWRQLLRAAVRVDKAEPTFRVVTDIAGGVLRVGVDAVDAEDRFLDHVRSDVTVVDPLGQEHALELVQTAAGRYEGRMRLTRYGPYTVRGRHWVQDGADGAGAGAGQEGEGGGDDGASKPQAPESAGAKTYRSFASITWPFPAEHLAGEPDLRAVRALAKATGGRRLPEPPGAQAQGAGAGRVPVAPEALRAALFDPGDHQTERRRPLWPLPLYAVLPFLFLDLLLRRVRFHGRTTIS